MAPFVFSGLILILCLIFWLKKPSLGLGLIIGGGIGNLVERAVTGTIHDMLVIGNLEFNPADILIAVGIVVIVVKLVPQAVKRPLA